MGHRRSDPDRGGYQFHPDSRCIPPPASQSRRNSRVEPLPRVGGDRLGYLFGLGSNSSAANELKLVAMPMPPRSFLALAAVLGVSVNWNAVEAL